MDNQFGGPQRPNYRYPDSSSPQQTQSSYQEPSNYQQPASSYEAPRKSGGKKKKFFWFLLVLILIAGAAYGTYYWQNTQVKDLKKQLASTKADLDSTSAQLNKLRQEQSKQQQDEAAKAMEAATEQAQTVYDALYKETIKTSNTSTTKGKPIDVAFINKHKEWFSTEYLGKANKATDKDGKYLLVCREGITEITGFDVAIDEDNDNSEATVKVTVQEKKGDTPTKNAFSASLVLINDQWVISEIDLTSCKAS